MGIIRERIILGHLDDSELLLPVATQAGGGHAYQNFKHMLRKRDRANFGAVCEYLDSMRMNVCLGGGVVRDWMQTGKRQYNDIDILAFPLEADDEEARLEIVRDLRRKVSYTDMRSIAGRKFRVWTPVMPARYRIEEGKEREGYLDVVRGKNSARPYLQGMIDERFILKPASGLLRASDIDVSLASRQSLGLK
ncbi:MAG: hypothetical protein AABW80_05075 [Nanoarchaeota archaeon]